MSAAPSRPAPPPPWAEAAQLELYPLDPWGACLALARFDHPHPEISRALVGPLPLGLSGAGGAGGFSILCLSTTADGGFAAPIELTQEDLNDPPGFWRTTSERLVITRQDRLNGVNTPTSTIPTNDSMVTWSQTSFWVRRGDGGGDPIHPAVRAMAKMLPLPQGQLPAALTTAAALHREHEAQTELARQIGLGVSHVILALKPELAELLVSRPQLSVSVACRLLHQAKPSGPEAVRYVMQALRTESLGLLHLAASEAPTAESHEMRQAIFEGRSLPGTLLTRGVTKAAHRRSLRSAGFSSPGWGGSACHDTGLTELPISGMHWLQALRLLNVIPITRWPRVAADWLAFLALNSMLHSLAQPPETLATVVNWSVLAGYDGCCARLDLLLNRARAMVRAARALVQIELPLPQAILSALDWIQHSADDRATLADVAELLDPRDVGRLVRETAHIANQGMAQLSTSLLKPVFRAHPGLPRGFADRQPWRLLALDSFALVIENGTISNLCTQDPAIAVQYVASGVALYVASDFALTGGCQATIALCLDTLGTIPKVKVLQVVDGNNAPASASLTRFAQSLADSWTPAQLPAWTDYARACAEFRKLAGAE